MVPSLIPLNNFASDDRSLCYLAKIFGDMYVIPVSSANCPGVAQGATISLLGTMFQTFNSVILAVAALVIVYVTVVGVMLTAHEGQFMGKNWSNLWLPIRMVLGIAALIPTGAGYSSIQIVMMWFIVQGIGAADMLWNSALTYVGTTGSPYAQVTIPTVGVNNSLGVIFQGLVCDASARKNYDNPYIANSNAGGYYSYPPFGNRFTGSDFDMSGTNTSFQMGPGGACGSFSICNKSDLCSGNNANSVKCAACNGQIQALNSAIPLLQSIANQFVDLDYGYQQYYYASITPPAQGERAPQPPDWLQAYCTAQHISPCTGANTSLPTPAAGTSDVPTITISNLYWPYALSPSYGQNFLDTITYAYADTVGKAVNAAIKSQNPENLTSKILAEAQKNGWILAGGYYFAISSMTGNNLKDAIPPLNIQTANPTGDAGNAMHGYRNNYSAASALISAAYNNASAGGGGTGGGGSGGGAGGADIGSSMSELGGLSRALSKGNEELKNSFGAGISGDVVKNPLIAIVAIGQTLLIIAEVMFITFLVATALIGLIGNFSPFVLGTGAENPVGPTVTTIYFFLVPMLLALLGVMVSTGGLLAVYIPLIPYVVFTLGAISWLLTTVEAMVAGPLVALGILSPGGQHELLGKSEPALMLLFSIFLRPSLMIFGLMASMLLATVVVQMINAAFWNVMIQTAGGAYSPGSEGTGRTIRTAITLAIDPLEMCIFLVAYVFLIFTALNKCFSAIYLIPQKVMEWLHGGRMAGAEGAEGLEEVKRGVQTGAGGAAGAGQWAGGQTTSAVKAEKVAGQQAKEHNAKDQGKIGPRKPDNTF